MYWVTRVKTLGSVGFAHVRTELNHINRIHYAISQR